MSIPGKIVKLDEVVVNRIAAGEVIQRPANALKELIENSLDAKSTNIQITAKEGGLKLLQIQDNGTGIRKDDMEIVCERFTTSKLRKFDDLKAISTFGFRGEALASISHVALLNITTKTSDEKCAYKASYINGKLKAPPKTCAGNQGTTIVIENLFYNVPTRRKALSSPSEEFIKILEVVMRYSVHNPMVGFTLKKHGETSPQVRTPHSSTKMNNVRILYGNPIARELLEIELDDKDYKFKMHALVTNPSYSGKRLVLLVFINNRLVDSTSIRKMLEELYSIYLPKKSYPWCYISLDINPCNIDVNVHPTKHEVKFLHEDSIIERVRSKLDEKLSTHSASKTVYLQTRLPQTNINSQILKKVLPEYDEDNRDKTKKIYQHEMVRTDSSDQKLDKFNFTVQIFDKNSSNLAHVENPMTESPKEKECCIDSTNNEEVSIQCQGLADARVNETEHMSSSTIPVNKVNSSILPEISAQCTELADPKIIDNFLEEASFEESNLENNFLCEQSDNSPTRIMQKECVDIIADKARKRVYQYFGNKNEEKAGTSETISPNEKKLRTCNEEKSETTVSSDTHKNECIVIKDTVPKDQSTLSQFKSYSVNNFRREVKLTSVLKLRKEVEDSFHEGLREILSNLIFVGCVNDTSAIVQSGVNLYICDTKRLAEELFYEIMLYDFANYGVIKFAEPLSLYELALLGLDTPEAGWTEEDGKKEDLATSVKELLLEKTDMMKEYFSIVIDKKGFLKSLPILLDKYFPYEAGLPLYMVRLATEVDWTTEQLCFRNICRETAKYYSEMNPIHNTHDWKHITEHVLYPAIKDSLLPPKQFSHDSTILQIASLPDLYKIFERC